MNQFEASLQRAAQGETVDGDLAPLVNTARSVSAIHVPPPPRGLEEGRRQLVAEASRLPPRRPLGSHLSLFVVRKMRPAAAVVSLLVVLALLPGLSYAVAASTDGPLHGLKILGQEARLWLTSNPEAAADLQVAMAEEQMEDIVTALEGGRQIDPKAVDRAEKHLSRAVQVVSQDGDGSDSAPKLRLMNTIQNTYHNMVRLFGAGSDPEFEPLHNLMRSIERAREQLSHGAGQAQGEQERRQEGVAPDDQEFGPHGPGQPVPAAQGTPGPGGPAASAPGPASGSPGKPADPPGPGHEVPPETTCTPAPTAPAEPQEGGGNQEQTHGEAGDDKPQDNQQPGHKGNSGRSRQP